MATTPAVPATWAIGGLEAHSPVLQESSGIPDLARHSEVAERGERDWTVCVSDPIYFILSLKGQVGKKWR